MKTLADIIDAQAVEIVHDAAKGTLHVNVECGNVLRLNSIRSVAFNRPQGKLTAGQLSMRIIECAAGQDNATMIEALVAALASAALGCCARGKEDDAIHLVLSDLAGSMASLRERAGQIRDQIEKTAHAQIDKQTAVRS